MNITFDELKDECFLLKRDGSGESVWQDYDFFLSLHKNVKTADVIFLPTVNGIELPAKMSVKKFLKICCKSENEHNNITELVQSLIYSDKKINATSQSILVEMFCRLIFYRKPNNSSNYGITLSKDEIVERFNKIMSVGKREFTTATKIIGLFGFEPNTLLLAILNVIVPTPNGNYILSSIKTKLDEINRYIKAGHLTIYYGCAGAGKSKACRDEIEKSDCKCIVVSQCNYTSIQFVSKLKSKKNLYKNNTYWSYTKTRVLHSAQYLSKHKIEPSNTIFVVEEASQMSIAEIDILLRLLRYGKKVILNGDNLQNGGFTSVGNLFDYCIRRIQDFDLYDALVVEKMIPYRTSNCPDLTEQNIKYRTDTAYKLQDSEHFRFLNDDIKGWKLETLPTFDYIKNQAHELISKKRKENKPNRACEIARGISALLYLLEHNQISETDITTLNFGVVAPSKDECTILAEIINFYFPIARKYVISTTNECGLLNNAIYRIDGDDILPIGENGNIDTFMPKPNKLSDVKAFFKKFGDEDVFSKVFVSAFAINQYKFQGGEREKVLCVLSNAQNRNAVYTSFTRAKQFCWLVNEEAEDNIFIKYERDGDF